MLFGFMLLSISSGTMHAVNPCSLLFNNPVTKAISTFPFAHAGVICAFSGYAAMMGGLVTGESLIKAYKAFKSCRWDAKNVYVYGHNVQQPTSAQLQIAHEHERSLFRSSAAAIGLSVVTLAAAGISYAGAKRCMQLTRAMLENNGIKIRFSSPF